MEMEDSMKKEENDEETMTEISKDAAKEEGPEDDNKDFTYVFPLLRPSRRKLNLDSPFFASGNLERELLAKQVILEISEEEKNQISSLEEDQQWEMVCPVVGCRKRLKGLRELETHFFSRHTAVCSVCSRVFPTTRLLDIHISETHDSFFQAKAARGHPMYKCLVDGCDMKFQNDLSRHQHLVDKHRFPQSFEFHKKKKHLSQKQRMRIQTRHQLNPNPNPDSQQIHECNTKNEVDDSMQKDEGEACMELDALTCDLSRMSTNDNMPSNISFGRKHNRGFALAPNRSRGRGRGRGRSGSNFT